jgi:aerobic-type carbon monoxide dehydrogenase small subunit (CoxS/CutS family)
MPGTYSVAGTRDRNRKMKRRITFELNGEKVEAEVESWWTLLYFIRVLGLTGTKRGRSMGECSACK